ncbi:histone deacetylase [Allohahella marinimesophila]|uniref:Histone deacetylase n=1 Tax=Allohahella marinimesophila TaxID=1054972 RepID=A0ABP7Q9F0_9GAMM
MQKFALLHERLHGLGLFHNNPPHPPSHFADSQVDTMDYIAMAHDAAYIEAFRQDDFTVQARRKLGLPWSPGLMQRTFTAVRGTMLTADLALEFGLAGHLAGGTHHAHHAEARGFCIFNDLAVTARYALSRPDVERVLILDCDVHQGDGTARILSNDPNALTVSVHCRANYPFDKAESDYDIEVEKGCSSKEYLRLLDAYWPLLLDRHQPDLVLYDAGADVHREDALGLLELDDAAIFKRDTHVIEACLDRRIPIACVIGGGYMKNLKRLAEVHGIVHQAAFRLFQQYFE